MLVQLTIENVAIIESAEVHFDRGFNVLSGETGAGKSVLLASLALVLGGRASTEMVRTGARAARVEACFRLAAGSAARRWLAEAGFPLEGDVVRIERSVPARGSGRSSINGVTATVKQLRALAPLVVDLSVQHAHHVLLDPEQHLSLLDDFAGAGPQLERMAEAWSALSEARSELRRLSRSAHQVEERGDYLRFQLRELDELSLQPGEVEELLAERRVQRHAVELGEGIRRGYARLYAQDGAAVELIGEVEVTLAKLSAIDPSLAPHAERLAELLSGIEEVSAALRSAEPVFDAERLDEIEGRLARAERLARKHACTPEALIERTAGLRRELTELENLSDHIALAEAAVERAAERALEVARGLRRARMKAAAALEDAVAQQLRDLSMPHARFRVVLNPLSVGDPVAEGCVLNERGLDAAELHLSANPGEEPRSIARIASGGELSRVLLALRVALRGAGGAAAMVFDEVDAGLSGAAAVDVGRKLLELSRRGQVLCITHLPQVAALADAHFGVSKGVSGGRTRSETCRLEEEGRVAELARLVGGSAADPASRSFARELLSQARAPRVAVA